jgi:hypothetical protein
MNVTLKVTIIFSILRLEKYDIILIILCHLVDTRCYKYFFKSKKSWLKLD